MTGYNQCFVQATLTAVLMIGSIAANGQEGQEQPDPLANAKAAMRAADFATAIDALDAVRNAEEPQARDADDEALYLKSLAQFHLKQHRAAIETSDALIASHPDSAWFLKTRFLKAAALAALRQFKEAEVIYEQEAQRLLSSDRKHEIAGVIISFAEALATKSDPNDVGALPPDYQKAYKLYGKVLEMEIARDLRDEVMFRRASVIQQAGNHGQAIEDFRAYLVEFDPQWTGAVGSATRMAGRKRENPLPAGKHILASRYHLVEAQLMAGQAAAARVNAEDLLKLLGDDAERLPADSSLAADTMWLLVKTYNLPQPSAEELDKGLNVTRDFLAAYPSHVRAVQAAWFLPETYRYHHRADQAIAEYEDFIAGDGFVLPKGDAATDRLEDLRKSPAELRDEWQKTALYRIGEIRFGQRDYNAATEVWTRYINQFPNGPDWSNCQRGVVNAEYQAAVDAVADKDDAKAKNLFEVFLDKHPLDSRAAQILFLFGQIDLVAAQKLEADNAAADKIATAYENAVGRWQRLVTKYPNTEPSSLALYKIGVIYEEKLGDLEKALETYRRLTWGSSAGQAKSRIALMTQKHLTVTTERKFRTNETAVVKVNTRNIEKLTFKQYFLDLEAYFRKTHAVGRVDGLDIDLIQPDKTWEVVIDEYLKYSPLEQEIEIPFEQGQAGVSIVHVSDEDFEATTLVVRSNLDLISKSSRREVLVFVQDMLRGEPAEGVKLLVSNGEKVLATGATGDDGVYQGKFDELKDAGKVRVFAMLDGSVASDLVDLSGLKLSQGLAAKGYLYTDRPAYQPGQMVKFRGIIREVKDGAYSAPANDEYEIAITDSAGRLLYEQPVALSEFGTFDSEFQLDSNAAVGTYQLVARKPRGPTYASTFNVQPFKLEKLRLRLDTDREVYFRGEEVELSIVADYYWGQPAAEKLVRYSLPDGRAFVEKTDAEGKLAVTFDTSGMQPGAPLRFQASIEGENVTTSHAAVLALKGFEIAVKPSRPLALSGEPIEVEIKTTTPDGEPVGKQVRLFVLRRATPTANPVLSGVPWIHIARRPAEEVTIMERNVETDTETGVAKLQLKDKSLEKGGLYILRVSGEDRFQQVVTKQATVQISDDDDATKLRLFSKTDTLQVGGSAMVRLHSRVNAKLALVTFEGETIISHRVMPLKKGFNPIDMSIDHQHFPNFRLTVSLMDGDQLRSTHKPFRVERELNVEIKPLAESYAPGELGKVELTVTDQLGRPVEAELSLALVDEALFAIFRDTTPNILQFFQKDAYRYAEFRQASTCGFRYEATTRRVIKAYLDEREWLAQRAAELRQMAELQGRQEGMRAQVSGIMTLEGESQPALNAPAEDPFGDADSESRLGGMGGGMGGGGGDSRSNQQMFGFDAPTNGGLAANEGANWSDLSMRRQSGSQRFASNGRDANRKQVEAPREELPEAGWWTGSIVTDANGKTTVEIPMPESTSEWRMTARGASVDTLVGQATASVQTRQDFFVTVKTPRSLQEGDSVQVIARVHNLTEYAGPVDLQLTVLGGQELTSRLAERSLRVDIEKQGVVEAVFDAVTIPSTGQLRLEVTAIAGDLSDTLAQTIPIRPWGLEFADQAGGISTTDATAYVELPEGRPYQTQWLAISVGPSLQQSLIDMAMGGGPLPMTSSGGAAKSRLLGGCIFPPPPSWGRQPGSDLLAVVSALEYAKSFKAPREDIERLLRRGRTLVSSLVVSQGEKGGWNWHGASDQPDWAVSSLNFWALSESKRLGLVVHDDAYQKGRTFLENVFTSLAQADTDAKAVVLHALSTAKAADFAHVNRLHRERNGLSSPALAYTALTLANLGRMDHAGEVLDVLEAKGQTDEQRLFWPGSTKQPWLNDPIESTAVTAIALIKVRPKSPQVEKAIGYLLNKKGVWGFTPAKANGPAVAALALYYRLGQHAADDYKLRLLVNGKEFETIHSLGAEQTLIRAVPEELVKAGKNQVDFKIEGRGEYAYSVSLRGFSSELKDPESWTYPMVRNRWYRHAPLEYRGRPIGPISTSSVKNIEVGQRVMVHVDVFERQDHTMYTTVEEHLPAGMMLVEGSLSGQFDHHVVEDDRILMYYRPDRRVADYRYELVGYATGNYRVLPTVIRDTLQPQRMRIGESGELRVLKPGVESDDPYAMNDSERFALGKLHFDDGLYRQAVGYLAPLFADKQRYQEKEVARMLLWIYTSDEFYDAQQIVDVFEVLRERFPTLEIPYDKILTVGKAYRDIGEFERAYQVYRATIDASFVNDSNVSAVLEDEGQFLGSIDYQEDLWRSYPDTADVSAAFFAISQSLYQQAPRAHELAKQQRQISIERGDDKPTEAPSKVAMLRETIRLLSEFLTLYPNNPLADDAAFSMANALLDLKQYELVVEACDQYQERFEKSDFQSGFQYMTALGHFWQRQHVQALAAATVVAEGESKDRDFARYIIGQIYHAENDPANAIQWYEKVATQYADAQQAIDYFEAKHVAMDEINIFKPGDPVKIALRYRNVAEARCQVYRVDLMRLYLREKNLANVTKVNLAGIAPLVETTIQLGDGKDYVDKDRTIQLDIAEEGAYLVICRGDDLFTSALALVTPLEVEVQEDAVSGRVRANVINSQDKQYVPEVHVKAIGSADDEFRSGETDLRGIFIADNIRGKATIIAREGNARYAFYRGDDWLGAQDEESQPEAKPSSSAQRGTQLDYQQNLKFYNGIIQRENFDSYDQMRRGKNQGVQVQKAQ
ncbi:Outer membrane protein assembly factor BamD [Novipirellula aureliae]|uniref:Outer membrane protein assembly factor BamD n=1 Tax=Novipirellula aureliae TaxID=2527966 RepID=A0A5C6DRJ4_9BACT|nr:MG2 domain-containing protein [Novipirellula aureliae]TWU38825.1 Outer membrane protein assembly factor BamD [Novipirellula aureliae]